MGSASRRANGSNRAANPLAARNRTALISRPRALEARRRHRRRRVIHDLDASCLGEWPEQSEQVMRTAVGVNSVGVQETLAHGVPHDGRLEPWPDLGPHRVQAIVHPVLHVEDHDLALQRTADLLPCCDNPCMPLIYGVRHRHTRVIVRTRAVW
jgi:hypothetical protein